MTMFYGKIHYKLPFSIAMFVYQRVAKYGQKISWKMDLFLTC